MLKLKDWLFEKAFLAGLAFGLLMAIFGLLMAIFGFF
jgi:hypothetical protein